jgi:hypothetical protein
MLEQIARDRAGPLRRPRQARVSMRKGWPLENVAWMSLGAFGESSGDCRARCGAGRSQPRARSAGTGGDCPFRHPVSLVPSDRLCRAGASSLPRPGAAGLGHDNLCNQAGPLAAKTCQSGPGSAAPHWAQIAGGSMGRLPLPPLGRVFGNRVVWGSHRPVALTCATHRSSLYGFSSASR